MRLQTWAIAPIIKMMDHSWLELAKPLQICFDEHGDLLVTGNRGWENIDSLRITVVLLWYGCVRSSPGLMGYVSWIMESSLWSVKVMTDRCMSSQREVRYSCCYTFQLGIPQSKSSPRYMSDMACICTCTLHIHCINRQAYTSALCSTRGCYPNSNHIFMMNTSALCMSNENSEIIAIIASCKLIARQFSHCFSILGIHIHRLVMPK